MQSYPGEQMIQNFNKATDEAFSTFCEINQTQQPCGGSDSRHEHVCTVNRTSMEYRTVYKMLVDDNCTDTERIKRFEEGDSIVKGRILRWNIADLFDAPQWHAGAATTEAANADCSHFCFVPVSKFCNLRTKYYILIKQSNHPLLDSYLHFRPFMRQHFIAWSFYCLPLIDDYVTYPDLPHYDLAKATTK